MKAETVVIIDDDDGFRAALRGMLQGCAAQVLEARGGREGLSLMRDVRPDLAFLDLRMADMDGSEVLAQMRSDPDLQAVPVVIVTSVELTLEVRSTLPAATTLLAKSDLNRERAGSAGRSIPAAKPGGRRRGLRFRRSLDGLLPASASSSYLCASLCDAGGQRGILLVEQPQPAPDESGVVLTQYARAASNAVRNLWTYDIERRIALTLQQNLLPDAIPSLPGLDVVARYEASAANAEVGGDFYEVFSLGGGRVALAIGDVVGHSLEAAMVMAQLRTGIRSYLLEGHGPAATLERLNRLLLRFHPDVTATACCAIYDRGTGRCELANAGHLPPLVVNDGRVRMLPLGGTLLGVDVPAAAAHVFALGPADVLLLFTDGLVERRGESIEAGLGRLADAARQGTSDLNELCDRLLREVGPLGLTDDIALVAIRPSP